VHPEPDAAEAPLPLPSGADPRRASSDTLVDPHPSGQGGEEIRLQPGQALFRSAPSPELPPEADYILSTLVGTGGHAQVWSAKQRRLDREVAVKVLRQAGKNFAERDFLQEAYVTASLDHPNIAPVYELTTTVVEGREHHLMAMKLVRGRPWPAVLAEDRRGTGLSFELFLLKHLKHFVSVCNAISYAHSKGVIHRDLKPSQVVIGDFGEVFVLDWGLAVLVDPGRQGPIALPQEQRLRTRDQATNPSGTPAYMAPEQTRPTTDRLGFHTDVYLLGAILYEIAAGRPPHDAPTAPEAFVLARHNTVPPLPEEVPEALRQVISRALQSDPARRFPSVDELAGAVDDFVTGATRLREAKHLLDEARRDFAKLGPRSGFPQLEAVMRMVQRALLLWPMSEEALELRDRILAAQVESTITSSDLSLARALLDDMEPGPEQQRLRGLLEQAEDRRRLHQRQRRVYQMAVGALALVALGGIAAVFIQREQALEARLALAEEQGNRQRFIALAEEKQRLADTLSEVTRLQSEELALADRFAAALPMPRRLSPGRPPQDAAAANEVVGLLHEREALAERRRALGKSEVAAQLMAPEPVLLILGEALATLHRARTQDDHIAAYTLFDAARQKQDSLPIPHRGMAIAAWRAGYPTSATLSLTAAAERSRATLGESHPDYADDLALLGDALRDLDQSSADFVDAYRASINVLLPEWRALTRRLAERHNTVGDTRTARTFAEALKGQLEAEGDATPAERAETLGTLAEVADSEGRYADAKALYEQILELETEAFGPDHAETLNTRDLLARSYRRLGQLARALELYESTHAIRMARPDAEPVEAAAGLSSIGLLKYELGQREEGFALLERALHIYEGAYGPDHPYVALLLNNLGSMCTELGRLAEAEQLLRRALRIREQRLGADHPVITTTLNNLAGLCARTGRFAEAEALYARIGAIETKHLGPEHPKAARRLNNMGSLRRRMGDLPAARAYYLQALALWSRTVGEDHPDVGTALTNLAMVSSALGDDEAADAYLARALGIARKTVGIGHVKAAPAALSRCVLLCRLGRAEEARALFREVLAARPELAARLDTREATPLLLALASMAAAAGPPERTRFLLREALDSAIRHQQGDELLQVAERWLAAARRNPAAYADDPAVPLLARYLERSQLLDAPMVAEDRLLRVMRADEAMASRCLAAGEPGRGAAGLFLRRSEVLARALDLPTTHPLRLEYLAPMAAAAGAGPLPAAQPPLDIGDRAAEGGEARIWLLEALAQAGAEIDWSALFPEVADWGLTTLQPAEPTAAREARVRQHLAEFAAP
jgi:serine/threonine protein kinase/tetratricopeptide (TPR) repeat protein